MSITGIGNIQGRQSQGGVHIPEEIKPCGTIMMMLVTRSSSCPHQLSPGNKEAPGLPDSSKLSSQAPAAWGALSFCLSGILGVWSPAMWLELRLCTTLSKPKPAIVEVLQGGWDGVLPHLPSVLNNLVLILLPSNTSVGRTPPRRDRTAESSPTPHR